MTRYYTTDTEEELLKLAAGAFGTNDKIDFHAESFYDALDGMVPHEKFKDVKFDTLKDYVLDHFEELYKFVGLGKTNDKLIFLDIDGVLNHQCMRDIGEEIKTSGGRVDKKCVQRLNHITDETGAGIVVSSTWRKDGWKEDGTPKVFDALVEAGVTGKLIDITPDYNGDSGSLRGNEIRDWLKANRPRTFDSFVILDDDSDMLYWQKENYVYVDHYIGLTPSLTYQIINRLGKIKDECMSHPVG